MYKFFISCTKVVSYMPRLDKATYSSLFSSLFYLKDWVIVYEDHNVLPYSEFLNIVSILFYNFIELIMLLCTFQYFILLDANNILFYGFHLVSLQTYYLLLVVQVLLVILDAFVEKVIFWNVMLSLKVWRASFSMNWCILNLRSVCREIIK